MVRVSRVCIKVLLLFFAILAVVNAATGCCNWVSFGEITVRPIAATWMLLSAVITGIREVRRGHFPIPLTIMEFALCVAGLVGVTNSLALFYYTYVGVPSVGTMLGFTLFWSVHLLLLIERVKHLKKAYFSVVLVGLIGVAGYVFDNDLLKYQFTDADNAMALSSAVFLMLLGVAAYSRERQGP